MTDRELLELAAKAAEIEGTINEYPNGYVEFITKNYSPSGSNIWNPLRNDGDALRLAIILNLNIYQYETFVAVGANEWEEWENYTDDPYTATRRAIVRAAAEIGEEMK